ncbi:MAG: uroporphyrinogen-III C-methyltransferase [Actinomycetota bacterium]|nr:uroporphyrinogen-III C-methyltransferase [Actinomycetota bacterium]
MTFGGPPALPGTVHLVGAGPGDPGLLTLRGARLLETCTLVASDRLVARELLDLVPATALRFEVGKRCGKGLWSQEDINRLLVNAAGDGHAVVRLKGGDPFVLGRGGEEAAACVAAGLPFEIVPGVTSAVAAPAATGIPVTHRGLASGFAVVTGHEDPGKAQSQVDWAAIAAFPGTLVVLMGLGRLSTIAELLIAHGRDPATPAAAVRWGTTAQQEVVEAPLGQLAHAVASQGLQPPVTVVIGEVVEMRAVLAATPALVGAA